MTKRRPYRSLFERLFSVTEPDIMWHRSVPASIRTPLTFLAFEYNIRIDELFKAMREEAMQQISEDDAADVHVGFGRIHSRGGRSLDYDIDIAEAMELYHRDQHQNGLDLGSDPEIEQLIEIYQNTIGWLYFWSVRYPVVEVRPRFAKHAEDGARRLQSLMRVKLCGRKWIEQSVGLIPGSQEGEV